MRKLVIYGSGSLGRMACQIMEDINEDKNQWNFLGFIDDAGELLGKNIHGYPVLGDSTWLTLHSDFDLVIAVAETSTKAKVRAFIDTCAHMAFATLVHPRAWISRMVSIGEGSIIYPDVLIDTDVKIGKHVVLNKSCTIGHDTVIGDYTTIAPGVNVGGKVNIGEGCFLGINSATIENLEIGSWSVIGAGAMVIHGVPSKATVIGIPARPIRPGS
jgi:sugar O-acyltransferase (sialic acid O-acetyltransferase NeuD family)